MKYDPYKIDDPHLAVALWDVYAEDPVRWIDDGCVWIQTKDTTGAPWERLYLWPAQREVVWTLHQGRRVLVLKARQLGLTWLCAALLVHTAVFKTGSTGLILSLREEEAVGALDRARGMYIRLPRWQRARRILKGADGGKKLHLSTGSKIHALSSRGGDSHTADAVLVDEAALIPDLALVLARVGPTVGDGGRLWLVSRANKHDPAGTFAHMANEALNGTSPYTAVFLPWHARPGRDGAWYEIQRAESLSVDGTLDTLHEQYPAHPQEALAPSTADRRLPTAWLDPATEVTPHRQGDAHGVWILRPPIAGRAYVVGADPAEGLTTSDDSALSVVDRLTGEEVAAAAGKWEPKAVFPALVKEISDLYNRAPVLVERNNHGHATIGGLQTLGVTLISGPDDGLGYGKSPISKAQIWVEVGAELQQRAQARAEALACGRVPPAPLVRSAQTYRQLALLEARTCKAPVGELDDSADAWGLAQWARTRNPAAWLSKLAGR